MSASLAGPPQPDPLQAPFAMDLPTAVSHTYLLRSTFVVLNMKFSLNCRTWNLATLPPIPMFSRTSTSTPSFIRMEKGLIALALKPHSWNLRLEQISKRHLSHVPSSIPGVFQAYRRRFIGSYHLSFWHLRSLFMRKESYVKFQLIRKSRSRLTLPKISLLHTLVCFVCKFWIRAIRALISAPLMFYA
jgi:hypothetical protein